MSAAPPAGCSRAPYPNKQSFTAMCPTCGHNPGACWRINGQAWATAQSGRLKACLSFRSCLKAAARVAGTDLLRAGDRLPPDWTSYMAHNATCEQMRLGSSRDLADSVPLRPARLQVSPASTAWCIPGSRLSTAPAGHWMDAISAIISNPGLGKALGQCKSTPKRVLSYRGSVYPPIHLSSFNACRLYWVVTE